MPSSRSRSGLLAVFLAVGLAACGTLPDAASPAAPRQPSASARGSELDAAAAELDRALELLERIHPEPFHAVDRDTFVAELEGLKAGLAELSPEEAATELMRIWTLLATERDGHQFALPLDIDGEPALPIRVYEFEEGVFITDAMAPHQDLVGARLTAVGETPIDEVLAMLEPLVPRDGPATVPSFRPMFLVRVTVLRGLGLAGPGEVELTVDEGGEARSVELEPVTSAELRAWAGWLAFHGLAPRDGLRHTQHQDAHFRVELLAEHDAVYVRYAQIQPVSGDEVEELRRVAALPEVERVIVDLRQNTGGDNTTYAPVLSALTDAAVDQPGRLVLMTDRVTFSAAANFATQVERATSAVFAGEAMGGGLNFWNDVEWIELPEFVLPMRLAVSTRYWEKSTPDDPRLSIEPDLAQPVRAADYFAGRDPLLDAVLAGEAG